jgi:cell division protein FtsI/penicillin-binding protein 2
MARGVGSIASGKRIQPHIFKKWGQTDLKTPEAQKLDVDQRVLAALRLGMKAVPEAPGSTAVSIFGIEQPYIVDGVDLRAGGAKAAEVKKRIADMKRIPNFKHLKCRAHGKTGTADIEKKLGYNSSWFIGWKNPLRKGGRRIAYACMTTHAIGNFRFGGTACGRIIRDILFSVELEEAKGIVPDAPKKDDPKKKDGGGTIRPDPGNVKPKPGTPPRNRDPENIRPNAQ